MNRLNFSRGIAVTGPQLDSRGIASYQITWHPSFFETPLAEDDTKTWLRRQAWLGTGSLLFSYLRERFPKAFVLTNFASLPDKAQMMDEVLGSGALKALSELSRVAVDWDYGFGGKGSPIRGEKAHVVELGDHNRVLPALMGIAPVELSFLLMLGPREMHVDTICRLMDSADDPGDWEVKVLSAVALMGFPHEEAMYTVKTTNREAKQTLDEIRSDISTQSPSFRIE